MVKRIRKKVRNEELPKIKTRFRVTEITPRVPGFEVLPPIVEDKSKVLREKIVGFFPDKKFLMDLPTGVFISLLYASADSCNVHQTVYSPSELEIFRKRAHPDCSLELTRGIFREQMLMAQDDLEKARLSDKFNGDLVDLFVAYLLNSDRSAIVRMGIPDFEKSLRIHSEVLNLHPSEKVFIPGCGFRSISTIEISKGRKLLLVDHSAFVVGILRKYAEAKGYTNVTVKRMDLLNSTLDPNIAEYLICKGLLHLFGYKEIRKLIENLMRALSPGGNAYVLEPISGCCEYDTPAKAKFIGETLLPYFGTFLSAEATAHGDISGESIIVYQMHGLGKR